MKARPAGLSSTSIDSTTPPVMSTGSRSSTSRSSSAIRMSTVAAAAGAATVDILMADDDLLVLLRLPVDMTGGVVESMLVDDSPAGRAFITQDTITAVTDDSVPRLRPDQRAGRAPRCARRRAGPDRLTPTHWRL